MRADRGHGTGKIHAQMLCRHLQTVTGQGRYSRSRIATLCDSGAVRSGSQQGVPVQATVRTGMPHSLERTPRAQLCQRTWPTHDSISGPQGTHLKTANRGLSTPRSGGCRLTLFADGGGCRGERSEYGELAK